MVYSIDFFFCLTALEADTIPPVITSCPDSSTKILPFGSTSISVTWVEPTATDNSGIDPAITQSHTPGDTFSMGTTLITYTFADLGGNEAVCTFTISVGKYYCIGKF